MFSTLSYCFGFASQKPNSPKEIDLPKFITEDVEDQWTLVELDGSISDKENDKKSIEYPTPPPSPPIEQSWLITPPPCFDAEVRFPVEELSPMENLLIEHPSIFIKAPLSLRNDNVNTETVVKENSSEIVIHHRKKKKCAAISHTKRRETVHKSMAVIVKRNRLRNSEFKRCGLDMTLRSHADARKRRRMIHQPRKNY